GSRTLLSSSVRSASQSGPSTAASLPLMSGHAAGAAVGRGVRQALLGPALHTVAHVVCVEAPGPEHAVSQLAAVPGPADHCDRLVLVEVLDALAGHQVVQRDVDGSFDPARLPLVGLPNVHDLDGVLSFVDAARGFELAHASTLARARSNAECVRSSNSTKRTS